MRRVTFLILFVLSFSGLSFSAAPTATTSAPTKPGVTRYCRASGSSDIFADCNALIRSARSADVVVITPGTYQNVSSTLTCNKTGVSIWAYGVAVDYTGEGNAVSLESNYCRLFGLKLTRSMAPGATVGLSVGVPSASDSSLTAHHSTIRDVEVTGFDQGIKLQLSFYVSFHDVDSHANASYNLLS